MTLALLVPYIDLVAGRIPESQEVLKEQQVLLQRLSKQMLDTPMIAEDERVAIDAILDLMVQVCDADISDDSELRSQLLDKIRLALQLRIGAVQQTEP